MRYQITNNTPNENLTDVAETLVAAEQRRLDALLEHFPQDEVLLRVVLDEGALPQAVRVSLRLSLPGHLLTAQEEGSSLRSVLDEAFDELRRQVVAYKERLRHEDEYKRKR
ncbi:HPF/RaiA family ribosome-associated protein [Kallotenue papyrolyticum]|uniref:HPF/RaiA family ribosome-associated protein n=1 Tax=Kallotenue papyrolyticum TaxID=1325125 RepID=UPI000472928F|nr:HPF/RaiA family ribosome-associated protein [Kallotenue papyrolyticum]